MEDDVKIQGKGSYLQSKEGGLEQILPSQASGRTIYMHIYM
jgi:hypothetical protein